VRDGRYDLPCPRRCLHGRKLRDLWRQRSGLLCQPNLYGDGGDLCQQRLRRVRWRRSTLLREPNLHWQRARLRTRRLRSVRRGRTSLLRWRRVRRRLL
jgi:hypothetical protein